MLSFLPRYIFPKITDISPDFLKKLDIQLLLMDYDNTMLPYTKDEADEALLTWLQEMDKAGISLCIVSNTHKKRAPNFAQAHGLACVTHAGKPGTRGIREAMFRFSCDRKHTAMVGDQIFTDVLGANLAGVTSIAVASIHNHNFWLKLRHLFELPFLAISHKRRVKP